MTDKRNGTTRFFPKYSTRYLFWTWFVRKLFSLFCPSKYGTHSLFHNSREICQNTAKLNLLLEKYSRVPKRTKAHYDFMGILSALIFWDTRSDITRQQHFSKLRRITNLDQISMQWNSISVSHSEFAASKRIQSENWNKENSPWLIANQAFWGGDTLFIGVTRLTLMGIFCIEVSGWRFILSKKVASGQDVKTSHTWLDFQCGKYLHASKSKTRAVTFRERHIIQ